MGCPRRAGSPAGIGDVGVVGAGSRSVVCVLQRWIVAWLHLGFGR
jgi:hypothetical protein